MERPTKPYMEVKAMLDTASSAWEKLLGYIRYHYVIDERWAEGKPTHKHYNNLFIRCIRIVNDMTLNPIQSEDINLFKKWLEKDRINK
ncbi:MAG: hypothetical protein FWG98_15315 [Candidatus Cloacimonetes bacterium]|nr:hypothetical protein [Candidatus Cloacimonadota bacterium]